MKKFILLSFNLWAFSSFAFVPLAQFKARPKLVVYLVVDQFRADFYTRFDKKFLPAGTEAKPGGFQYLISKGAYYPMAEYKVMEAMTCPGHAIISTGTYPSSMGIPMNDWYDRELGKQVGCVEDEKLKASPHRLTTSTVGDELKILSPTSKVISIALKDRAAIMLGGHHANYAFWFQESAWGTSPYYADKIPAWVESVNKNLREVVLKGKSKNEIKDLELTPAAVDWTTDLVVQAIEGEKLGQGSATDILAISFSSHDMAGHKYGPYSKEVEQVCLEEDKQISKILQNLKAKLGSLKDVVVVLTGDHGMPPSVEQAQTAKLNAGKIDSLEFYKKIADRLNAKFGKASHEWIKDGVYLNYYIDREILKERKVSLEDAEKEIKAVALTMPGVYDVFTSSDFENGLHLPVRYQEQILNQYRPDLNGDVVIIPQPFYMGRDSNFVTHMTGYSYDRYVPLVIMGSHVKAGVYAEHAEVIDVAPTLSFMLNQIPPAKASGRILNEIF
jgi:predicted AlkP superfamily pyrophosphatase or phosphodiesterase